MPVLRSWRRTIRYHFGSLAFGSLIIVIVQFFRIVLEYIDHKMRSAKQGNSVVKVVMMCMKCCLWCFEKCLKFLNKEEFLSGDARLVRAAGRECCTRGDREHHLEPAHDARQGVHRVLLHVLHVPLHPPPAIEPPELLPRRPQGHHELDLPHAGTFTVIMRCLTMMHLTGLLGYATTPFSLDVYGMGIDTTLLCSCEDCNVNKGSDKYYMSDELFAYIEDPTKKNAFQSSRDVSARTESMQQMPPPATAAPIYQASSPMQKKF